MATEQINTLDNLITSAVKTRDQMVELMRQYNLEGVHNPQRFQAIEGTFKFEQDRIGTMIQKKNALIRERAQLQLDITQEACEKMRDLQLTLLPALFAMRAELELPIDQANYTKMTCENIERQGVELGAFIAEMRKFISEHIS